MQLTCNTILNYAQSLPPNADIAAFGSLVDLDIHDETRNNNSRPHTLPDFKTQIQQFLKHEKKNPTILQQSDPSDPETWTVFTVLFGLWDLMEYAKLERPFAMAAIENSVKVLLEQLDLLAEVMPTISVVIPSMIDMTFLPRFQAAKNQAHGNFAESQHLMVFLSTYWNAVLLRQAVLWNNGDIFMPDMNSILINQVRSKQLYSDKISDAWNVGRQSPMFDNVVQPCLTRRPDENMNDLHTAGMEKCADPAAHLFWQVSWLHKRIVSTLTRRQGRYPSQWYRTRTNRNISRTAPSQRRNRQY